MIVEVDVKSLDKDVLIDVLIKKIEDMEKLLDSYRQQVSAFEESVRKSLIQTAENSSIAARRLDKVEKGLRYIGNRDDMI